MSNSFTYRFHISIENCIYSNSCLFYESNLVGQNSLQREGLPEEKCRMFDIIPQRKAVILLYLKKLFIIFIFQGCTGSGHNSDKFRACLQRFVSKFITSIVQGNEFHVSKFHLKQSCFCFNRYTILMLFVTPYISFDYFCYDLNISNMFTANSSVLILVNKLISFINIQLEKQTK